MCPSSCPPHDLPLDILFGDEPIHDSGSIDAFVYVNSVEVMYCRILLLLLLPQSGFSFPVYSPALLDRQRLYLGILLGFGSWFSSLEMSQNSSIACSSPLIGNFRCFEAVPSLSPARCRICPPLFAVPLLKRARTLHVLVSCLSIILMLPFCVGLPLDPFLCMCALLL